LAGITGYKGGRAAYIEELDPGLKLEKSKLAPLGGIGGD
jgi:hypothetical protein